jgi:predicted HTH domain antitoxin
MWILDAENRDCPGNICILEEMECMQTVTIPVSEEILTAANLDTEEMAAAMSRDYAMKMFQQGKLTLMQSAELCNMNIYDFLSVLSQANIPVINYGIDGVKKELSYFKRP